MNIDDINQRIERVYAALSLLKNNNFSDIKTNVIVLNDIYHASVDFNGSKTEVELKNSVFLLISNIASIKDHLKNYCSKNKITFEIDKFINSDINVAIVHDLWNIDKHPQYNKPRSGFLPKIINLSQVLQSSAGTEAGGYSIISFDSFTGKTKIETGGSGSVDLVVSGSVTNERGGVIGDLVDICNKALSSWEIELNKLLSRK